MQNSFRNLEMPTQLGMLFSVGARLLDEGPHSKTDETYAEELSWLDGQDPMGVDCASLIDLLSEARHDTVRGYLSGLLQVKAQSALFGGTAFFKADPAAQLALEVSWPINDFSDDFLWALERVCPMTGSIEDLVFLAHSAECLLSCGFVLGIIAARSELMLICPQFGDGLALNDVLQQVILQYQCALADKIPKQATLAA